VTTALASLEIPSESLENTTVQKQLGGLGLALLLLAAGCSAENTQLVLTIDSDLLPVTEVGAIQVKRLGKNNKPLDSEVFEVHKDGEPISGAFPLPLSVAVVPPEGNVTATVTLDISALSPDSGQVLFTRRVVTGFRAGKTLLLPVFLAKRCSLSDNECMSTEREPLTCSEIGCISPVVDVTMLNEVDPGQEVNATIRMPGNPPGGDAGIVIPEDNDPPTPPSIELSTTATGTLGRVEVNITQEGTDPDQDPITYRYRWAKNGERQGDPQVPELTSSFTTKGEVWRVDVYANDGYQDSLMAASATVTIMNTAPSVTLTFTSTSVRSIDLLEVSANVDDPDNDPIDLSFAWTKNSSVAQTSTASLARPGTQTASVSAEMLTRGDVWSAQITVTDGEGSAQATTEELTILSAPPVVVTATIGFSGNRPITTSSIILGYTVTDPDPGDRVARIEVEWLADNQALGAPNNRVLAPEFTRKHQLIEAKLTVYDDADQASAVVRTNPIRIENSPPVILTADIVPDGRPNNVNCQQAPCTVADELLCVGGAVTDLDGDPITLRYNWYRNTTQFDLNNPSQRISGTFFSRFWGLLCGVTPFDGEAEGATQLSSNIYIDNAVPTISSVQIQPSLPRKGSLVTAQPQNWQDADLQDLPNPRYRFEWLVDGQVVVTSSSASLNDEFFAKNQEIQVRVTPFDGFDFGQSQTSTAVTVQNTPPSIGLVRLRPETAYTETVVTAEALAWFDSDDDPERFVYQWFVDGNLLTGEIRTSLPASATTKNQIIRAVVTPFDGQDYGTPLEATITVQNTPPLPPRVRVGPAAPVAAENLSCTIVADSIDADNDPVSYTYAWKKNGQLTSETSSVVQASETTELEVWTCEVTPYDGTNAGSLAADTTIIRRPKSSLAPAAIHAHEGNTCIIQRSPAGLLCWDDTTEVWPFVAGNFSGFVQTAADICALNDQNQLVCPRSSGTSVETSVPSHWAAEDIVYSGTGFDFCYLESGGNVACTDSNANVPAGPYTQIAGGNGFGCGLRTDQTIRCWGSNTNGTATPPGGTFVQLREGYFLSEALSTTGEWENWGQNQGTYAGSFVPTIQNELKRAVGNQVACALGADGTALCASFLGAVDGADAVPDALFSDITAGNRHACGVTLDGDVLCWGNRQAPVQVAQGAPQGLTLSQVAVGDKFACGLESGGRLRCWGSTDTDSFPNEGGLYALGYGQTYVDVWAKASELCAKRTTGEIDCFGERFQRVKQVELARLSSTLNANRFSSNALVLASGMSFRTESQANDARARSRCDRNAPRGQYNSVCLSPGNVGHLSPASPNGGDRSLANVVDAAGGYSFACTVSETGEIQCWGNNGSGQATPPATDPANPFVQVSAGGYYGCALKQDGTIACWGNNNSDQATPPTPLAGNPFTAISSGNIHNCALAQNGIYAWCWGSNQDGRLNAPVATPSNQFVEISAGHVHNCALKQDGSLACWGNNNSDQATPPANDPANPFVQVSAGYFHSCAVKQDGSIACWGDASEFSNLILHGFVPNDQNTGFAFGPKHHCSLRPNGSAECSGENDSGQATPPAGVFTKLFARDKQTCGIRTTGAVECWGNNDDLQSQPPPNYNFIEVGLAPRHACGIATNTSTANTNSNAGGIVCWGYNGDGRADRPASIQNRHDFVDIDCTELDCAALATDGTTHWFGQTPGVDALNDSNVGQLVWDSSCGCTLSLTGQPNCTCYTASLIDRNPPVYVTP